jgi:hypothetical protein
MPISAMTSRTAGLIRSAGSEPADVTRTFPAACRCSRAAAIWDLSGVVHAHEQDFGDVRPGDAEAWDLRRVPAGVVSSTTSADTWRSASGRTR